MTFGVGNVVRLPGMLMNLFVVCLAGSVILWRQQLFSPSESGDNSRSFARPKEDAPLVKNTSTENESWRWSPKNSCKLGSTERENLVIHVLPVDIIRGYMTDAQV